MAPVGNAAVDWYHRLEEEQRMTDDADDEKEKASSSSSGNRYRNQQHSSIGNGKTIKTKASTAQLSPRNNTGDDNDDGGDDGGVDNGDDVTKQLHEVWEDFPFTPFYGSNRIKIQEEDDKYYNDCSKQTESSKNDQTSAEIPLQEQKPQQTPKPGEDDDDDDAAESDFTQQDTQPKLDKKCQEWLAISHRLFPRITKTKPRTPSLLPRSSTLSSNTTSTKRKRDDDDTCSSTTAFSLTMEYNTRDHFKLIENVNQKGFKTTATSSQQPSRKKYNDFNSTCTSLKNDTTCCEKMQQLELQKLTEQIENLKKKKIDISVALVEEANARTALSRKLIEKSPWKAAVAEAIAEARGKNNASSVAEVNSIKTSADHPILIGTNDDDEEDAKPSFHTCIARRSSSNGGKNKIRMYQPNISKERRNLR